MFAVPVILNTQSAAQRVRRQLDCCYICADALPAKGPNRRSLVSGEHVIPRSLLGASPARLDDRWSIELDVHRACEAAHKQGRDALINIIHASNVSGVNSLNSAQFATMTNQMQPGRLRVPDAGDVPVMSGGYDAILGVILWIRGLHAALYGKPLPSSCGVAIVPPVPVVMNPTTVAQELRDFELRRNLVLSRVAQARLSESADRILAWGGALDYSTVWCRSPAAGDKSWFALWALYLPDVLAWSASVLPKPSPWCGYYELETPPERASVQYEAATSDAAIG